MVPVSTTSAPRSVSTVPRGSGSSRSGVYKPPAGAVPATGAARQATLNRLLFPGPTRDFEAHREEFGDTSQISANQFFYGLRQGEEHRVRLEKGVELLIGLEAISEPDEKRTTDPRSGTPRPAIASRAALRARSQRSP